GRVQVVVGGRETVDARKVGQLDRDHQRVRDARRAHRLELRGEVRRELGKIEVAVRVDEQKRYSVCVGRDDASVSPRIFSIAARAAAPVSSWVNWTPMPCVRLPCTPSGVIHTTLPCTAMRLGSSISDSSMKTSSPSA